MTKTCSKLLIGLNAYLKTLVAYPEFFGFFYKKNFENSKKTKNGKKLFKKYKKVMGRQIRIFWAGINA